MQQAPTATRPNGQCKPPPPLPFLVPGRPESAAVTHIFPIRLQISIELRHPSRRSFFTTAPSLVSRRLAAAPQRRSISSVAASVPAPVAVVPSQHQFRPAGVRRSDRTPPSFRRSSKIFVC
ncbi:hypothetical protein Q3G72_032668 [Acer saccharum]|nr:hypothetical protein Q3G72_032668 [Acer saccharum]